MNSLTQPGTKIQPSQTTQTSYGGYYDSQQCTVQGSQASIGVDKFSTDPLRRGRVKAEEKEEEEACPALPSVASLEARIQ